MAQHDIGPIAEMEEGRPLKRMAGETAVLVIRRGQRVTALAHACPHFGLPLSKGHLDGDRLICAFHHACFDVSTGRQTQPPGYGDLRRYDVDLRDGNVFVTVPEDAEAHPAPDHACRGDSPRRVVIAGAGAAADACALKLREGGFAGTIEMIAPEGLPPYDRTFLSKAVLAGGDTPRRLTITSPEALAARDVELVTDRIIGIDSGSHEVRLESGGTRGYDSLVIATGGTPRRLDVPGAELDGVWSVRGLRDAEALSDAAGRAKRAVLVGGGFIGLEAALSLSKRGLEVTVVLPEDVPLSRVVGSEIGRVIMAEHEGKGVHFVTGAKVTGFEGDGHISAVTLEDGDKVEANLAVVAIGVRPSTDIDGLTPDKDGGLSTDANLAVVGHEDIYAAGDVARVPGPWGAVRIEHWRVARQHGAHAAATILGQTPDMIDVPFFWTALGRQYRYLGHAEDWDEIRFDGDPSGDFIARYVKDGNVMAMMGAGRDAEIAAAHAAMIRAAGPIRM